jgi:hypothetical protein
LSRATQVAIPAVAKSVIPKRTHERRGVGARHIRQADGDQDGPKTVANAAKARILQSVTHAAIGEFFREYVYGFMRADIQKQLDLAKAGAGGANVLAALGLLVYTESLGRIRVKNGLAPGIDGGPSAKHFNACFDLMGYRYPAWRRGFSRRTNQTVYRAFRNGMAHEYAPKVAVKVVMFGTPVVAIVTRGTGYVFVVEAYLAHLMRSAGRIERQLLGLTNPTIPPPD